MGTKTEWKPSDTLKVGKKALTLNDWAARLGCPVQTIIGRLKRGWDVARAVSEKISDIGGQNRGKTLPAEVLTSEECAKILEACNDSSTGVRNRAMIVVGWRAGVRITETLDLLPHNVDLGKQSIRILHGKGDKARSVGIDGEALEYLVKWLEVRKSLGIGDDVPLFCTLDGRPVQDRYVRALMARLAKECGIRKRVHFHGLRHTNAAELAAEGVPMNEIQQHLGHSSLKVTSEYLSHLAPEATVDRLRSRSWNPGAVAGTGVPRENGPMQAPPDWVDALRGWIGTRLCVFHDSRRDPENFRAIVLLVD